MREYRLENYEEQLTHQVIHMDQAVCYNPEFCATLKMHDYPSRKLQLARAVYKKEMPVNDYIGDLVYSTILSRQGERWQNFREDPEDCTDAYLLCREILLKKGYKSSAVEQFKEYIKSKQYHVYSANAWNLPEDIKSDTYILLDDAAACGFASDQKDFQNFCEKNQITFLNKAVPEFIGFEYFAYGLIEEGIEKLQSLISEIEKSGAKKVIVLSAQAKYMLTVMAKKVGIKSNLLIQYLPEIIPELKTEKEAYVYAGSFNVRYLCNADMLNKLIPNTREVFHKDSIEFIPLLHADHRVNKLTIWQRPLGAEYRLFGVDEKILESIKEKAICDIEKAKAEEIIVFEPTAMEILKEAFPEKEVKSYLKLL